MEYFDVFTWIRTWLLHLPLNGVNVVYVSVGCLMLPRQFDTIHYKWIYFKRFGCFKILHNYEVRISKISSVLLPGIVRKHVARCRNLLVAQKCVTEKQPFHWLSSCCNVSIRLCSESSNYWIFLSSPVFTFFLFFTQWCRKETGVMRWKPLFKTRKKKHWHYCSSLSVFSSTGLLWSFRPAGPGRPHRLSLPPASYSHTVRKWF